MYFGEGAGWFALRHQNADQAAFETAVRINADMVVYEVTDQRPVAERGDLIFGVTNMQPGRVGNEFFMTRGHGDRHIIA